MHTGSATDFVRASESAPGGVKRVAALYAGTPPPPAGRVAGSSSSASTAHSAGGRPTVPTTGPVQVIAMAQNANGLVAYSANKGVNFPSVTDTTGPDVLLESPAPDAVYLLNQRVPATFSCSDAGVVASCVGAPLATGWPARYQPRGRPELHRHGDRPPGEPVRAERSTTASITHSRASSRRSTPSPR